MHSAFEITIWYFNTQEAKINIQPKLLTTQNNKKIAKPNFNTFIYPQRNIDSWNYNQSIHKQKKNTGPKGLRFDTGLYFCTKLGLFVLSWIESFT